MTRQRVREGFCYLFKFVVKVKLYSYLYDDEEQKSQKIRSEWIVKGVFHVIFVSDKWNTCMHLCFHFFLGDYVSFIDVIVPKSEFRVTSYDHLNFSRASVVQFQAFPYIMRLNRTSIWKVMTILISRELPLFNFERLDIICAWIGLPCDKLWPFEFLESFRCSISSV